MSARDIKYKRNTVVKNTYCGSYYGSLKVKDKKGRGTFGGGYFLK